MTKKKDLQRKLIFLAEKQIGKPYKFGAKLKEAPNIFDCSSFIQYLFKKIGIDLPRTALQQAHFGKKVKISNLEPGDLIFLKRKWGHYNPEYPQGIGHVAMYIGDNMIIHAFSKESTKRKAKTGKVKGKVAKDTLKNYLKNEKPVVIKRILK